MKNRSFIVSAILFLCVCPAFALIHFKDGQTHNIDYEINDGVYVDYHTPAMYTIVNLLPGGGIMENLKAYENSRINILGGSIGGWLYSYGSSQADISSGTIGYLYSHNTSQVDISSGSINYNIYSYGSSQINISGGLIGEYVFSCGTSQIDISGCSIGRSLIPLGHGKIQVYGTDFAVDGQPFGYGELTSIHSGDYWNEPIRHLTGTLLSGEIIDNDFQIGDDAKIILIPEPGTVLLLGLGGLLLRKRRNRR